MLHQNGGGGKGERERERRAGNEPRTTLTTQTFEPEVCAIREVCGQFAVISAAGRARRRPRRGSQAV